MNKTTVEIKIDEVWWDALSEEWKSILIINQNLSKQGIDIYSIQSKYVNRLNTEEEENYSEINTSLHDLNDKNKFSLGFTNFYERAIRHHDVIKNDRVDLTTLIDLETIYMVNGPGDLTPLKKFPNLKVLILNGCGIDHSKKVNEMVLDLEPLRNNKNLQVLHCSSIALQSIEPIRNLLSLKELNIENSMVTDLTPLKKLVHLEVLFFGSKVKNPSVISNLKKLRELYISGAKTIPDLSYLSGLQKLSVCEHEFSLVDAGYRIQNLKFLEGLSNLEYLDLEKTSFKGDLDVLYFLPNIKAVALPPVSNITVGKFKKHHKDCIILNHYRYE